VHIAEGEFGGRITIFCEPCLCPFNATSKTATSKTIDGPKRLERFREHRVPVAGLGGKVVWPRDAIKRARVLNLNPICVLVTICVLIEG
jgi:hypothetical protein